MRHLLVLLILGTWLMSGACEDAAAKPDDAGAEAVAEYRAIAQRFLDAWAKECGIEVVQARWRFAGRDFSINRSGWHYEFERKDPRRSVYVSLDRRLVVFFTANHLGLRIPSRREGKDLTDQETESFLKEHTKVPLDEARQRAHRFVAKVYPDFEKRDFKLIRGELRAGRTGYYDFHWEEVVDLEAPKNLPNDIELKMNPKTGVVVLYRAEDYSLPKGFRLGMTAQEADKKAEESVKALRANTKLELRGKWGPQLWYLPVKQGKAEDRVYWGVSYWFAPPEGPEEFMRYVDCCYDATTGEPIPKELLDQ